MTVHRSRRFHLQLEASLERRIITGGEHRLCDLQHAFPDADDSSLRRALAALVTKGRIISLGKPRRYKRYEPRPADETKPDDFRVAGKITVGRGSYWGAGLA